MTFKCIFRNFRLADYKIFLSILLSAKNGQTSAPTLVSSPKTSKGTSTSGETLPTTIKRTRIVTKATRTTPLYSSTDMKVRVSTIKPATLFLTSSSKTDKTTTHSEVLESATTQADDDMVKMTDLERNSSEGGNLSRRRELLERFKREHPVDEWLALGMFGDDYYELIDTLWLEHPPTSPSAHYLMAAAYCLIAAVGLTGNALVICMFIKCRSLRTPANILVVNLAVSDFLMLLSLVLFVYQSYYLGPVLGVIGCQVYGFMGGLTGTCSIATLAAIALDRYYVIVHPLRGGDVATARARACVVCAWGYGATFSCVPLLDVGAGRYVPEGFLTSCSFDYLTRRTAVRAYIWTFFCAAWVLPLALITFCYSAICRAVVKTAGHVGVGTRHRSGEDKERRTEVRLAVVVAGVVCVWVLSWTPYAAVALLGVTGRRSLITPLSSMVPAMFCKTASCVDPFVYAVTHPRFRQELRAIANRSMRRTQESGTFRGQQSRRGTTHVSDSSDVDDVEEVVMTELPRPDARY